MNEDVKRVIDFFLSLLVIVLLGWLFVFIGIAYLLTFQWPIFFTQERIGLNNIKFIVIKFRTLSTDESLDLQKRRFRLGDILRRLSVDELPQVWNVLKGEMSWVGPRPLPLEYLPLMNDEQKKRHIVKPGITGWTQVNGRNNISWEKKFELDLYYVRHQSFWLDLKILIKTVGLLLSFKQDKSLEEVALHK